LTGFDRLASGFGIVEAPTLDDEGALYFSDISKGGVYRLAPSGEVEVVVPKRKGVGGIALHQDGGIVVSGRDISHIRDGVTRTLLGGPDCPPPGPVMGFNDLCADPTGKVLVGPVQLDGSGVKTPQNVIRINAPRQSEILYPEVVGSNGIGVDLHRKQIFNASSRARLIIVSTYDDEGTVSVVRRFATTAIEGVPDGLRVDVDGCIWVAFYGGGSIVRFSPQGEVLHVMETPARQPTSLCFGGADMQDLYVTSHDNTDDPALGGCVFRTRAPVAGVHPGRVAI
jgi:xylono-1,5-lactonase